MSLFAKLPSLSIFEPMRIKPDAYPMIAKFQSLEVIRLSLKYPEPTLDELMGLCSALESCKKLAFVEIADCRNPALMDPFLNALVKSVRSLKCLRLDTVAMSTLRDGTASVDFLTACAHLETFYVHACIPFMSAQTVMQLVLHRRLPTLQTLRLRACCILDEGQQHSLCSQLKLFHYDS